MLDQPQSCAGALSGAGRHDSGQRKPNQGFAHPIHRCLQCSYQVDSNDVADPTIEQGCAWATALSDGDRQRHGPFKDRLPQGTAGIPFPKFCSGCREGELQPGAWDWDPDFPHRSHDVLSLW